MIMINDNIKKLCKCHKSHIPPYLDEKAKVRNIPINDESNDDLDNKLQYTFVSNNQIK